MFRIFLVGLIAAIFSCALPHKAWSSPFISSDNDRLRSHLIFLSDSGVLDVGVTTWPIMWRDVARELSGVDVASLNDVQRNAVYELRFELRRERESIYKRSIALQASSSANVFTSASHSDYEKFSFVKVSDWDGDDLSLRLQAQLVNGDDYKTNLDGSYFVGALGNWVLGVGAIDRWWGPGNSSSLILSHNARPAPGLIFRTNGEQRFDTDWLSWLGAWQFTSFVSQLESDRHIPEAKLTGMRFSFRPIDGLELGVSRAMMWGGEGRGNDLSSFWKSLTATDENTYDGTGGTGNQLGGFDFRYGYRVGVASLAMYAQLIGEDEAGAMPSKYLSLFGVQVTGSLAAEYGFDAFFEYSDTVAGSLNEPEFGVAYEHSAYQSGYHFRGRALGSTFDGDSRVWNLGAKLVMPNRRALSLNVLRATINRAGRGRSNTLVAESVDVIDTGVRYSFIWHDVSIEFGGSYQIGERLMQGRDGLGADVNFEYRY